MKKKGFTLIELLAVIVVLGLIALIVIPSIGRLLRSSQNTSYDVQIDAIISATKNWEADNPNSLPKNDGEEITIYLSQLKTGNYINKDLINPKTDLPFADTLAITIINNNGRHEYEIDPDN